MNSTKWWGAKPFTKNREGLVLNASRLLYVAVCAISLSKFLVNYKNTFLVISHNFDFLNSCCNVILALENKKLTKYKGNYDQYIKQRDMNMETYQKEYEKQQKEIKRTEEFIQKNIVRASTTKQAQSRRKQLEKMVKLEKP